MITLMDSSNTMGVNLDLDKPLARFLVLFRFFTLRNNYKKQHKAFCKIKTNSDTSRELK